MWIKDVQNGQWGDIYRIVAIAIGKSFRVILHKMNNYTCFCKHRTNMGCFCVFTPFIFKIKCYAKKNYCADEALNYSKISSDRFIDNKGVSRRK